jgi:hypothetical protein
MDLVTHKVCRGAQSLDLTTKEFDLLEYLLRHSGRVVSREMLARDVWQASRPLIFSSSRLPASANSLLGASMHVSHCRFGAAAGTPQHRRPLAQRPEDVVGAAQRCAAEAAANYHDETDHGFSKNAL